MTTDERNILMAEFKGWSYNKETGKFTKGPLTFRLGSFQHDKSWDMLIEIINLISKRFTHMMNETGTGMYVYFDLEEMALLEIKYAHLKEDLSLAVMSNDIHFAHKVVAEYIEKFNKAYKNAEQQYEAEKYEPGDLENL